MEEDNCVLGNHAIPNANDTILSFFYICLEIKTLLFQKINIIYLPHTQLLQWAMSSCCKTCTRRGEMSEA